MQALGQAASRLRPVVGVELPQRICERLGEPEVTQQVIATVQRDGSCWCGITVWQGQTAMRISVSSWATTDEDVELSLIAILRAASEVGAR